MSSDMVQPRRAASCFKTAMTESSMFNVVFIHITIHRIWLYVKMSDLREILQGASQFSTLRPGIPAKWRTLPVTTVRRCRRATAAI